MAHHDILTGRLVICASWRSNTRHRRGCRRIGDEHGVAPTIKRCWRWRFIGLRGLFIESAPNVNTFGDFLHRERAGIARAYRAGRQQRQKPQEEFFAGSGAPSWQRLREATMVPKGFNCRGSGFPKTAHVLFAFARH